jgi:hypothetical protein
VDHHRNSATPAQTAPRGQIRRQRHISAEPDDHVGIDVVEHRPGLADRAAHPQRQPNQVTRRLARQRNRGDELEVVPAFGHQPRFQPALGAQRGDPHVRIECGQGVGNGHSRFDVPRGTTAGEDHRDGAVVHPYR